MEESPKNSKRIITALILLIVFVLILFLFLYLIRNPAIFGSFAKSENGTDSTSSVTSPQNISYDNSYIFASPLKAATSTEKIRLTVYILDGQGMGVNGKTVILSNGDTAIHVYPINQVTDSTGRAIFDISSDQSGNFTIGATVDGKNLSQKVTVAFN